MVLMKTKMEFKYGRFEFRAALPSDKILKTTLFLEPTLRQRNFSDVWSKDGKIFIISNNNSSNFYYGINFAFNQKAKYVGNTIPDTDSLFDFHSYAIEWTEKEIRWFIDAKHLFTASFVKELAIITTLLINNLNLQSV